MSVFAWRVVVFILAVFSLASVVYMGHASLVKPGFLDLEFLGFFLANMAYIKCIEIEYRLREKK